MTREDEILKAARDYVGGVTLSSPSNVIYFEYGAKWADEHPNLSSLWYDASEEPKNDNRKILFVDIYNNYWIDDRVNALFLHNNWDEYVAIELVKMWAYIDDLLPKQFGNSEQLKGGEK